MRTFLRPPQVSLRCTVFTAHRRPCNGWPHSLNLNWHSKILRYTRSANCQIAAKSLPRFAPETNLKRKPPFARTGDTPSIQACCQDRVQTGNEYRSLLSDPLLCPAPPVATRMRPPVPPAGRNYLAVAQEATALQPSHWPRGQSYLQHTPPHSSLKHLIDRPLSDQQSRRVGTRHRSITSASYVVPGLVMRIES